MICDKDNMYSVLNEKDVSIAMHLLKPNTFKLWYYMAKNQNGYVFALSKVAVCNFCGFKESSYHDGVKELIAVGYLKETSPNHYSFYKHLSDENELTITVFDNKKQEQDFVF